MNERRATERSARGDGKVIKDRERRLKDLESKSWPIVEKLREVIFVNFYDVNLFVMDN